MIRAGWPRLPETAAARLAPSRIWTGTASRGPGTSHSACTALRGSQTPAVARSAVSDSAPSVSG
eukprot:14628369-Alexandrium_andersonii.AAC.1